MVDKEAARKRVEVSVSRSIWKIELVDLRELGVIWYLGGVELDEELRLAALGAEDAQESGG